jgi:hypothetical protein
MKRVRLREFKHLSVNDRPLRLHQVKDKCWSVDIVGMQEADCRVVSLRNDLRPDLTFEHGIGVV